MRRIIVVVVSFVSLLFGGCRVVPAGYGGGYYQSRYAVAFLGGRPTCIIPDDGSADWAMSVRGADRVYHEREAHRWVESHPDYNYAALPHCAARESAGSSRGQPGGWYYYRRW